MANSQEQTKPVAWLYEARHIDSAWKSIVTLEHPGPEGVYMRRVRPLYTAPPDTAARIAELERERDDFHMQYRVKCDEETKAQAVRIAELDAALKVAGEALETIRREQYWCLADVALQRIKEAQR